MIAEGQIVLLRFPQTNKMEGKLRPALVIRQLPVQYDDWLICMVSSQIDQKYPILMRLSLPVIPILYNQV